MFPSQILLCLFTSEYHSFWKVVSESKVRKASSILVTIWTNSEIVSISKYWERALVIKNSKLLFVLHDFVLCGVVKGKDKCFAITHAFVAGSPRLRGESTKALVVRSLNQSHCGSFVITFRVKIPSFEPISSSSVKELAFCVLFVHAFLYKFKIVRFHLQDLRLL